MLSKEPNPMDKFLAIADALVKDAKAKSSDYSTFKNQVKQELSSFKTILENHVTLAPWHASQIKNAVALRIRFHLSNDALYSLYGKRFYSALWRDLKNAFHVAEYREIPRVRFDAAMEFIRTWYPQVEIIGGDADDHGKAS